MIEPKHPKLLVAWQFERLELPRATCYHRLEPDSGDNLVSVRIIDEIYPDYPLFGSRQMAQWL